MTDRNIALNSNNSSESNRFKRNVYKMATSQIAVIMAGLKIPINFGKLHY